MTTDNQAKMSGRGGLSARERIVAAFNAMVLSRRREPFPVGEIIRHARVARSTFYDHFGNESALRLAALSGIMDNMADALTGRTNMSVLSGVLDHFWDHRQQVRPILLGRERARIETLLAETTMARIDQGEANDAQALRLCAAQISAASFAAIDLWVGGKVSISAERLAQQLIGTAAAIRRGSGPG